MAKSRPIRTVTYFNYVLGFAMAIQAFIMGDLIHFLFPMFHFPENYSRTIDQLPDSIRDQYKLYAELDHKFHLVHDFEQTVEFISKHDK